MDIVILTGASRGLGAALADLMLSPNRRLVCVARTPNQPLEERARQTGSWLDYYLQDLVDVEGTDGLAASICGQLPRDAKRYVLINNAGVLGPVGSARDLPGEDVVAALHVNVAAAMMFTSRFLEATEGLPVPRQILNISSGAARRPIDGWSVYCATKAALDMFSRCVKVEQARSSNPARIASLAPGVIDTAMQTQVRSSDPADFPERERFVNLKANNELIEPRVAAQRIMEFLDHDDFGTSEIAALQY